MLKEFLQVWRKKDLSREALDEALTMLRHDQEMFLESQRTLREGDGPDFQIDIYKQDKLVNKAEREVRRKVLQHLIISDKCDINAGLTLASVVIDIERIGDYTKNIADLVQLRGKKLSAGEFEEDVTGIENQIKEFFKDTIEAFPTSEAEIARKVVNAYKPLSATTAKLNELLVKGQSSLNAADAVALSLYIRFLKRVAAHLYNVCTSIVNPFPRIGYKEKKTGI